MQAEIVTALGPNDPDDGDAGRLQRGMAIAALAPITKNKLGYSVPSQSGKGKYVVNVDDEPFCSCPDFELRQQPCKHIYSVEFLIQREERPDGTTVETKAVKVSYSQNWSAYNAAQTNEGDHFVVLLRQLCDLVPQPEYRFGRPKMPLSDMIFGMAQKVYSGMSTRRAMSGIRSAKAQGLLDVMPSYVTICRYMENPELKPIIQRLIEVSAQPLASVETTFAPDSSGFSSSVYDRWFSHKWGKEVKEVQWVKAHIMTGVNTQIVTAADATATAGNDSPYLVPFLNTTAQNFDVQEVVADKGYLSKGNLWAINEAGAAGYIPFKTNSVAQTPKHKKDELWAKMFHYFNFHRSDFLAHYHQRSNVETAFSMIKRKFGGAVLSKKPEAQVNETLVKILCHNIVVLIHEMYELGIEPVFRSYFTGDGEMISGTEGPGSQAYY